MTTATAVRQSADFWTLDRVADALGFGPSGVPRGARPLAGVSTDTRHVEPGQLFVALSGDRFDGHDFLADAVSRGAAAVVVRDASRTLSIGVPVFQVDDTNTALGSLARYR